MRNAMDQAMKTTGHNHRLVCDLVEIDRCVYPNLLHQVWLLDEQKKEDVALRGLRP